MRRLLVVGYLAGREAAFGSLPAVHDGAAGLGDPKLRGAIANLAVDALLRPGESSRELAAQLHARLAAGVCPEELRSLAEALRVRAER
ncbi:MAG: hypothetical protein IPM29_25440 [Planctomycetes bacterium]|nr:hypothetical protein [Planctomycetota bacterium]